MKEEKILIHAEIVEVADAAAQVDTEAKKEFALLIHTDSAELGCQIFIFSGEDDACEAQRLLDCAMSTAPTAVFFGRDSTNFNVVILKPLFFEPTCHVFHFDDEQSAQTAVDALIKLKIFDQTLPF